MTVTLSLYLDPKEEREIINQLIENLNINKIKNNSLIVGGLDLGGCAAQMAESANGGVE